MLYDSKEELRKLIEIMSDMDGFDEFYNESTPFKEGADVLESFKEWKESHGGFNEDEIVTMKILFEKMYSIKQNIHPNKLSGYASHLFIQDPLVKEFLADFSSCMTGEVKSKKADRQHYKTITEEITYFPIDIKPVYHKYRETLNPYINSQLAQIFNRGEIYDLGLWHLQKTLGYIFTYPNPYWDTPIAVYGCTEALWELQYLLGNSGFAELGKDIKRFKLKTLELLFLYLSRSIHIVENSLKSAEYLSNRATLLYDYSYDHTIIFTDNGLWGVNPQIQFMSDKAYAYAIAETFEMSLIFEQDYKDSLKMYQHGSLIPNGTGGLREMEDATMGELNKRGWSRSVELANRLFLKFQRGYYFLDRWQIENIMDYLKKRYINN